MSATAPHTPAPQDALDHAALLYRGPEQLRSAAREFAEDAAAADEPLLAVLAPASAELLADVFADSGAAVSHIDAGDAGRNPSRLIPMVLDWLPGSRSRVISESIWPGRADDEVAECLRHEALVNVALADQPVSVLCPFDAAHLPGEVLAGAEMTHPRLVADGGERPSPRYGDPLALARGEHWPQAQPAPPVLHLRFDGDLWALRRGLAGDELLASLDPGRREDFVFAINEAASNAIRHGDGTGQVRVWRGRDRVVCEIATTTPIDDPLAGRRRPSIDATSGRGMWLINQLCDLVEVRSGDDGASVRMHVAG